MQKKEAVGFYKKDGKTRPITAPSGQRARKGSRLRPTALSPAAITLGKEQIEELKADPQLQAEEGIFINPFGEPYRLKKRGNWVHAVALDGRVLASVNTKTGETRGEASKYEAVHRAADEASGFTLKKRRRSGTDEEDTGRCAVCGRKGAPWQPQAGGYIHYGCLDEIW